MSCAHDVTGPSTHSTTLMGRFKFKLPREPEPEADRAVMPVCQCLAVATLKMLRPGQLHRARGGIVILSGSLRVLKVPCHFGVGPPGGRWVQAAAAQVAKFKLLAAPGGGGAGRAHRHIFLYESAAWGAYDRGALAGAKCTGSLRWLYKMRGSLSVHAPVPLRSLACLAVLREPAASRA